MNKKAFTLVELIVVITILAVLWTIGFISYTWYTSEARDSARLADMWNIKKAIDLNEINTWKLPEVTNPVEIKVWTQVVFSQWTFWNTTIAGLKWLISQNPKDPLTKLDYSYSVTSDGSEYELGWYIENDKISYSPISQANAWLSLTPALLRWNYNWQFVKVISWEDVTLYASPSITVSDTSVEQLVDLADQNKLVYDWFYNLPANFASSKYNTNWWNTTKYLNKDNIVIYNWSISDLNTETNQLDLLSNLKTAYNGTDIQNEYIIKKVMDLDTNNHEESTKSMKNMLNILVSDKIKRN